MRGGDRKANDSCRLSLIFAAVSHDVGKLGTVNIL